MLPDLLKPNLKIVFCGTAAGSVSAKRGFYYAGPGNKFYPILHKVGLTPYQLKPNEFSKLLKFSIGLTDIVKNESGSDDSLNNSAFDVESFKEKINRYGPKIVAFNGKKAAAWALGKKGRTGKVEYGISDKKIKGAQVIVLPSTSGAANGYWDERKWIELAELFDKS
ncbi:MAG: mismatch-specific DNA-glycosylase [Balneola sp.]|nr:mismatch-specific DNA-glycosylase [Balneola sp.]|tara:strand:+ start:11135 stop:11635 length:501 start_codon:yes stop_codon:yes gene_type:complete